MNKFSKFLMIASLASACGCANTTSSIDSSSVAVNANIWHIAPTLEADTLKNLAPLSKTIVRNETHTATLIENMNGYLNEHSNNGYSDNVIVIQKENTQDIYDYDGNHLYSLSTNVSDTYNEEGITVGYAYLSEEENFFSEVYGVKTSSDKVIVFDSNFKETTEIDASNFILHPYDGNQSYDEVAIKDTQKGIYSPVRNSEGGDTSSYEFTKFDGYLADVYIAESIKENNKVESLVIATKDGEILSSIDDELYEKESGMFVNGFLPVYQKDDETKKIAMFQAKDGTLITDFSYTDVGYYEDGYCPVENEDGKWAYIDEEGNLVTEFIFDMASSLYEGKAWVIKDGMAGVINLKDIATSKTLKENDIYADDLIADIQINENEEEDPIVGEIQIQLESINVRKDATTSSDKNGTVSKGETYSVYEIKEADGYTWYCIGENKWVASGNDWVTYSKK